MVFQERTYGVLIVSASEQFFTAASDLLPVSDYWPVETAKTAAAARRLLLETQFDIVLIQTPRRDEFGTALAADVCRTTGAGALLLVRQELYDDVYAKVMEDGVTVLPVPTTQRMMAQTLRMLCAARERMRRMEEKQATVEEKIEEIRLVDRAKWLLIERLHMSEQEAHHYLEKQAMDLRQSIRAAAENVIRTYR